MAGTITHLVIADQLLRPLQIQNPALFYCGNLAPDAIMARKGYIRSMKHHTHFKDGIATDDLHLPEKYAEYRRQFAAFCNALLKKEDPYYELYLGYVTHMIADEVFILTLRDRHVEYLRQQGKNTKDPEYFQAFGRDVDRNDWRLVREYAFSYSMPQILLEEQAYEIPGFITNEELLASKQFIIQKNFQTRHEEEKTEVLSYEEIETMIKNAVIAIIKELKEA